jgi:hypothetical protein
MTVDTLKDILEWMYMYRTDGGQLRLSVAWWDVGESYYAVVTEQDGNILFGESSYGSASAEEALAALQTEISAEVASVLRNKATQELNLYRREQSIREGGQQ